MRKEVRVPIIVTCIKCGEIRRIPASDPSAGQLPVCPKCSSIMICREFTAEDAAVRNTSEEAYRIIKPLLIDCQWHLYDTLYQFAPLSKNEGMHMLRGKSRDGVHQRFGELRKFGLADIVGRRKCTITTMTVNVWDVTSKVLTAEELALLKAKKEIPFFYYGHIMDDGSWGEWFAVEANKQGNTTTKAKEEVKIKAFAACALNPDVREVVEIRCTKATSPSTLESPKNV